jgi:hypothetical protein
VQGQSRPGISGQPGRYSSSYGMIGIVNSGEVGSGHAGRASNWLARVSVPRVLIPAVAVLVLTNIPLSRYHSGGHLAYVWSSLAVLLILWRIWRHGRLAWGALTAATAITLILYGLAIVGVINTSLPGWWISITGTADIVALAILLSPSVRRWLAEQPDPAH